MPTDNPQSQPLTPVHAEGKNGGQCFGQPCVICTGCIVCCPHEHSPEEIAGLLKHFRDQSDRMTQELYERIADCKAQHPWLIDRRESHELRSTIDALRTVIFPLIEFGDHMDYCQIKGNSMLKQSARTCDCGRDQAVSDARKVLNV